MADTYTGPNSDTEKVRFYIQDTASPFLLTDGEIDFMLSEAGGILEAALACAEVLVARGAHKVTKKIGDRQINYSDLTAQYQVLAATLRDKIQRADFAFTVPEVGSVADGENYPAAFEPSDVGPLE